MDANMQEDVFNNFNFVQEHGLVLGSQISTNACLDQICIPHLGQYGNDYDWLHPCMAIRSRPSNRD